MMFSIKMANKPLKLVLCYSLICTKFQNGIQAEDWYACAQAIVAKQTGLNCLQTGTGKHIFLLSSQEAKQHDENFEVDNH